MFVSQLSILLAWNFMICSANWQCIKKLSRILRWRLHVPLPIVDNNGASPQHQPMQESSCKRDLSRQSKTKMNQVGHGAMDAGSSHVMVVSGPSRMQPSVRAAWQSLVRGWCLSIARLVHTRFPQVMKCDELC